MTTSSIKYPQFQYQTSNKLLNTGGSDNIIDILEKADLSISAKSSEYEFIETNIISSINLKGKEAIHEIKNISYLNETVEEKLEEYINKNYSCLNNEIEILNGIINKYTNIQMQINEIYTSTNDMIIQNDPITNEILNFYSNFKLQNKSNIIRADIVNTFLSYISLTKNEKESLLNKENLGNNTFSSNYYKLLLRIQEIKSNVELVERHSINFSKNLLLSIKQNISSYEEVVNERLILYIKNIFKEYFIFKYTQENEIDNNVNYDKNLIPIKKNSNTSISKTINKHYKVFSLDDFKFLLVSIKFIKSNINFEIFLQKEYLSFRKKLIDDLIKFKYFKLTVDYEKTIDSLIISLSEEYEYLFLREVLLMYVLFYNYDLFLSSEIKEILNIFNMKEITEDDSVQFNTTNQNNRDYSKINKLIYSYLYKIQAYENNCKSSFGFQNFLNGLNSVFYPFSEYMYESINYIISTISDSDTSFSIILKISVLFGSFINKIKSIYENINIQSSDHSISDFYNLLYSSNDKFNKMFNKSSTELFKKLQKHKLNLRNILFKEKDGDKILINVLLRYASEYKSMFEIVKSIENDNNSIKPLINHQSFILILNMFDEIQINDILNGKYIINNQKQHLSVKILNFFNTLKVIFSPYKSVLLNLYDTIILKTDTYFKALIEFIFKNIIDENEFFDSIAKILSQEEAFSFVESISEKCEFMFIFIEEIQDKAFKEEIKSEVKKMIINLYSNISNKHEECLYVLSIEDFKSFLI